MSMSASMGRPMPRSMGRGVDTLAPVASAVQLPASLDALVYGQRMYQDAGMTLPVTADGQTIAKWVSVNGLVGTCTSVTAQSVGGLLVPKSSDAGGKIEFASDLTLNRRDLTLFMHLQRPGCFTAQGLFGMGTGRDAEVMNYSSIKTYTYDGTSLALNAMTAKASPCTLTIRNNATNLKAGINGNEIASTSWAAGTLNGGIFCNAPTLSLPSSDRVWALGFGPRLNDTDYAQLLEWADGIRARPSETAPTMNLGIYHDSQWTGNNAGGHSCMLDLADANPNLRIIPAGGSAQYFSIGGGPENAAGEITQMNAEKVAGAVRNVILFVTTNDFNNQANGTAYYAAVKSAGQAFMAGGWEAWVVKFPHRASPYTDVGNDPNYNTNVDQFNALVVSDPWYTGFIDLTGAASYLNADGVHWNSAGQTYVYNQVKAALGLS